LGLNLTTALTEPAEFLGCPVHVEQASHAGVSAGEHGVSSEHVRGSHDTKQKHDVCTCLDHCCAVMTVALMAVTIALVDHPVTDGEAAHHSAIEYVPAHRAHELPFANGPPAAELI
jgi:hypothetical protein